jgi:serine/threonine protein kinase
VKCLGEGLDSELKSTREHEYKQHIPEDLQRFMLKMLVKEPAKRASIVDLKNDKWLN